LGNNGGPYNQGKLYCGFCGEYRYYGVNVATAKKSGILICVECGIRVRSQGRHWIHTKEPKRY